jgi:hypothetical protein
MLLIWIHNYLNSVLRYNLLIWLSISGHSGHAVAQWLRHCTTNRKVAGSIPYGVIGIFHRHNAFVPTMALRSTHPLTEMSTMSTMGVKVAGA